MALAAYVMYIRERRGQDDGPSCLCDVYQREARTRRQLGQRRATAAADTDLDLLTWLSLHQGEAETAAADTDLDLLT